MDFSSAKQPGTIHQLQKAPALALRPENPQSSNAKHDGRQAAQDDVFLREVDDALRQDEMLSFFNRYGKPLIAVVVIGLLALAGYLWWDHASKQRADENGEKLTIALDEADAANLGAADKHLVPLAEGDDASAAAAKLMRAGIALRQNRNAEAVKLYAEVAADDGVPQPYRDLALIREVAANFDAMEPQQVVDRLKPLAVPGNAWFGNAAELVGIAYLKQGNEKLAGPLFAQIARDEKTPESLRRRARQLAGLLGVDAVDDPKTVVGDEAAAAAPAAQ
jgi:hypothetical protein